MSILRRRKSTTLSTGIPRGKLLPKISLGYGPGARPVNRLGQVDPTYGFVVLCWCKKGNVTSSTELGNLMIKLSKLASDHGANAISYDKSGTEIRFYFLRLQEAIFAAAKRGKASSATSPGVPFVVPVSR